MRSVAILLWRPLSKKKIKILNLNYLKKNYKVSICDVTKIIFPKYNKKVEELNFNVFKIKNLNKLSNFFNNNSFDLILNVTGIKKNSEIYKLLLSFKIPILSFYTNTPTLQSFYPYRLFYLVKNFFFYKIFYFFKKKNLYEYSYLMSDKLLCNQNIIGTNIINGFDNAINELSKEKKKVASKNKIVFLDQNWGDNADYFIHYNRNLINRFKFFFYKELIFFLKNFEKNFDVKITILLHPFSEKKDWKKYKDFKTSIDKTIQEIKSAKLVIGLWSSALNYAVLLKKNILIINSNEFLYMTNEYKHSEHMSKLLNDSMPFSISKSFFLNKRELSQFIIKPNKNYRLYENFFLRTKNNRGMSINDAIKNILDTNRAV